ncbi:MAG: hypothetical protein EBZ22_04805, partial [Flavobacteriia bacterium]|nr:hypothetical protein [Flavobacteriia bacterium]
MQVSPSVGVNGEVALDAQRFRQHGDGRHALTKRVGALMGLATRAEILLKSEALDGNLQICRVLQGQLEQVGVVQGVLIVAEAHSTRILHVHHLRELLAFEA